MSCNDTNILCKQKGGDKLLVDHLCVTIQYVEATQETAWNKNLVQIVELDPESNRRDQDDKLLWI